MNKIEFKQFLQNTKDNIQEKLNPKKIGTKISVSLKSKKTRKNLIIYAFLTFILHSISVTSVCVHKSAIQGLMRR